jgi:hypothetical protein
MPNMFEIEKDITSTEMKVVKQMMIDQHKLKTLDHITYIFGDDNPKNFGSYYQTLHPKFANTVKFPEFKFKPVKLQTVKPPASLVWMGYSPTELVTKFMLNWDELCKKIAQVPIVEEPPWNFETSQLNWTPQVQRIRTQSLTQSPDNIYFAGDTAKRTNFIELIFCYQEDSDQVLEWLADGLVDVPEARVLVLDILKKLVKMEYTTE